MPLVIYFSIVIDSISSKSSLISLNLELLFAWTNVSIGFLFGYGNGYPGSELWLDAISISTSADVIELSSNLKVSVPYIFSICISFFFSLSKAFSLYNSYSISVKSSSLRGKELGTWFLF